MIFKIANFQFATNQFSKSFPSKRVYNTVFQPSIMEERGWSTLGNLICLHQRENGDYVIEYCQTRIYLVRNANRAKYSHLANGFSRLKA